MNQEMQYDFNNLDDPLFFDIPEFNPPSIKKENTESNFLETMEWDSFTNQTQNDDNSFFLEKLFSTEGNIFDNENSNNEQIMTNDLTQNTTELQINNETSNQQIKVEEIHMEKIPQSKKSKTDNTQTPKKKSKKQMTPEELEQKKKMQLEKRLIKNRRTAEISRKRKKAKKFTLEESLQQLTEQSVLLEKQSIEVSCENRVLKTEYYALLSLILNIPALAKKFDKISEIVVDQKEKKIFMDHSGQFASVYLFNLIYSIHQQWIQMKESINQNLPPINDQSSLQNIIVN